MRQSGTKTTELRSAEVWTARPTPASEVLHLLDEQEQSRLARFRFERDADSYASAHALVRLALSSVNPAVKPSDWSFHVAEFGKPELPPPSDLRFNLSHTRDLVAAGTLVGAEIGVDVEAIGTREVAQELRSRVLSPLEVRALDELPLDRQARRFFAIWSLKESFIKACGLGLRMPLREISFAFDSQFGDGDDSPRLVETPSETSYQPEDWQIHLGRPQAQTHALGVTAGLVQGRAPAIRVTHVDLTALVKAAR
ncbi:MAG: 4'-phosphopantetheinyl transferase [Planctomycetota bacterium]|jgi:4'-phosphopantetheinyl transferase